MNRSRLSVITCVGLLLLSRPATAQLVATKPIAPLANTASADKSAARTESDRIAKERREQARSLLISLAGDARSFRDQPLRARSLARIADVLWSVDTEQGRALFRRAWEAAEIADQNQGSYQMGELPLNLRREVLKLAGRRDRLLAEEFLQKLKADEPESKTEPLDSNLYGLSAAGQQRLDLAQGLLGTGDIERALQFADPVLGNVTLQTVDFLTRLRDKDPAAADRRYAAMLQNTRDNMVVVDANKISVLSSYIFTPHLYVIFSSEGVAAWSRMPDLAQPAHVDPQLRLAFFQTAAAVLLRPPTPSEPDPSRAGIAGTFMVVKRLMPLFEQYAPRDITEAMQGQFEALNSLVSDGVRQGESDWVQKGISPEKSLADQEHSLFDQLDHARTSDGRDDLYFKLALLALSKDDMKARDFVSKIEASWVRKLAQGWVDWGLALGAIKRKKVETALELARIGELTHLQRVWILTQSAKLLAKTDRDQAILLLDDAAAEARRIEGVDLDRPRGQLAIANALQLIEPDRAWDVIFDAVKAANSAEGFTGEGGVIRVTMNAKGHVMARMDANPDFDIEGIFGKLANEDYDRVIQLARGFQGEAPRANATIATARALLEEKSASVPITRPATKH
jgi:hypothetical protein